jgi:hypothetical protein
VRPGLEPVRTRARGIVFLVWFGRWARCRSAATVKLGDRRQQFSPVSKRDADLLKVCVCQVAENGDVNVVVDECRRLSLQANRRQPFRNLLHQRSLPIYGNRQKLESTSSDWAVVGRSDEPRAFDGLRGSRKRMVFRSLPKTPNETPTLLIKIAKEISAPSDVL